VDVDVNVNVNATLDVDACRWAIERVPCTDPIDEPWRARNRNARGDGRCLPRWR